MPHTQRLERLSSTGLTTEQAGLGSAFGQRIIAWRH